ncbi:MAG TPA: ABC transporter ATP-binding protein, partial [Nevskiales bacterium]|nr:ABC transporter ATP-binding protein [Nevskiales bacterium]
MSTVLDIQNLSIRLPAGADRALAVESASLQLHAGRTLCVVGESGSGKSMIANAVMGLLPRPQVAPVAGRIVFEGRDLLALSEREMRALRGSRIGMIFQEPMTSLNPLMRIGEQIAEVLDSHLRLPRAARRARVLAALRDVGLPDPEALAESFPHRLSGGQRQRVMIAAALALAPTLLIADEPTTALDVTTQAQILALIKDLQKRHGMAVLFITHDFGVVAQIA